MSSTDRKTAIANYKKRTIFAGIYAVRCRTSGEVWVGRALDVDSIETRLRFGLRTRANVHRVMQAAWNAHGGDSFEFEVVELMDPDDSGHSRDSKLRDRLAHWRASLGAASI